MVPTSYPSCPGCGYGSAPVFVPGTQRPTNIKLIALMWGLTGASFIFWFQFSSHPSIFDQPFRQWMMVLALISDAASVFFAVKLVRRFNHKDQINGWFKIGLESVGFLIGLIYAIYHPGAQG
jgi:hypothetical protein